MRPYHYAWIICLIALFAFAGIKTMNVKMPVSDTSSPVAGVQLGGTFTLTDQDGKKVTDKSWPNKYLLIYFGFTHCPDICPVGLSRMTEALKQLPSSVSDKIQPIFITVDPSRDTAKVIKEYVVLFDKKLVGLTGTEQQIKDVEKLYRVYAQKEGSGDDYMVNHSGYTYLMKPDGQFAAIYAHETTSDDLAKELKKIVLSE